MNLISSSILGGLLAALTLPGGVSALAADGPARVKLGDAVADGRPSVRWRGFNLLEMFYWNGQRPADFREKDFRIIRDWGFNFVRLPMDYRFWIQEGDWERFDGAALKSVDRAVELGRRYGVHVCLCLHRCPGYSVAQPPERLDLFTSAEAQRVCARHWAMFARRYRGVPNAQLSFNLFNEPGVVDDAAYGAVVRKLVEAIRREDPERFVIADGRRWGREPTASLAGLQGVGQAMRGYDPMSVTHHLAPWVDAPSAKPVWPLTRDMPRGTLGAAAYAAHGMADPLALDDLPAGRLTVAYGKCFGSVTVEYAADGEVLKTERLEPKAGDPQWYDTAPDPRWGQVAGWYRGTTELILARPVRRFTARIAQGEWTMFTTLRLEAADGTGSATLDFRPDWGRQTNFHQRFVGWSAPSFAPVGAEPSVPGAADDTGRRYLLDNVFAPWERPIAEGGFVFCGEFGVWKKTPHAVALALMRDYLALWRERNIGWALWNLRGENGVLDSGRDDVAYEDFRGHRLDRKMLELLQTGARPADGDDVKRKE